MGWAYGTNAQGREIGYGVEATCDKDGCDDQIDRGVDYVCGDMHDGGKYGCGRYFCGDHLLFTDAGQLCEECADRVDEADNDESEVPY
jgi:hypothetical protein